MPNATPVPADDPDHVGLAPMPENVQTQAEANKKVDDMFG